VDWKQESETWWSAVSDSDTRWDIVKMADDRYGCIVANWDRPDWYASSLDEAKALCEKIDARPPVPKEQWIVEKPFGPEDLDGPPPKYGNLPPRDPKE
jgi:hypothetical protein